MARPRAFDQAEVVRSATRQFWRHGFHSTSAEDLCRATGLGRSSLYNTFGSKDGLFAACLEGYLSTTGARTAEMLGDPSRGPLERIESLLTMMAEEEADRAESGDPKGCLAVNTVAELADDPDRAASVRSVRRDTETRLTLFADVLRTGQATGEVTTASSPEGLAAYLNAAIAGLRISSQGGASPEALREIVRTTMRGLRPT
ncbi:TetR/AcrR family transcriptional regulator [Nocardiopsis alba]|uniref:TetR/AcrR family transcriptional regulator n=1 Tax=Nocardiopsis alba TaxID=53437 RepID=UPI0033EAE37E